MILKSLKEKLTKKFYLASVVCLMLASALTILSFEYLKKKNMEEHLAPLARSMTCGQSKVMTEKELEFLANKWLVNHKPMLRELRENLIRNIIALPEVALKVLEQNKIRFTAETGQTPYTCAGRATGRTVAGLSCVKATLKDGLFVVVGESNLISPNGAPLNLPGAETLESSILSLGFWVLFRGVWHYDLSTPVKDSDVSIGNRLLTLRKFVISGFNFSDGEKDFFHKSFGPSGAESAIFLTRSLILTASNIYCSEASYENLLAQQPEAVRRFWFVYGCTLGKPWFMTDDEFTKTCDQSMSQAK